MVKGAGLRANSMWSRVTKSEAATAAGGFLRQNGGLDVSYVYLRSPIHPKTDFVKVQAVHRVMSEAETDDQKIKLIEKMISELGLDSKSKS